MKFSCSNNHFYKLFIHSILDMEPTYLVQDYLNQVQYIYFDEEDLENPSSEISIQSDDITALREVVSRQELNKIMMHRFVDGLKKMITNRLDANDNHGYHQLCIRVGEYREHLLSYVQNINEGNEVITPKLKSMENKLSNNFKTDRHKAALDVCKNLELESGISLEDETGIPLGPKDYEDITEKYDADKSLEFLTHNRNQNIDYKTKKSSWESYKAQFDRRFKDLKDQDNDTFEQHIQVLHELLISTRINEVQTFKAIQNVITSDVNNIDFLQHSTQKYLKSNLWKISLYPHYRSLLSTYTYDKDRSVILTNHNKKLKSRTNSLHNNRQKHMDKSSYKLFNTSDTLQLLLHIEMYSVLNASVRKGNLEMKDQNLIKDYINMVEDMRKYLVYENRGNNSELYLYMKLTVFQDLFGRTKIDAANIFTTTIEKMEETLSTILNNSNYNFASFNIIKLLKKFITAFDEFIVENDQFNHKIHSSEKDSATGLPNLNEYKKHFDLLEKHTLSYKDFTKANNINFQKESLILKTFNATKVYDEK